MKTIVGGSVWIGTEREVFDREENPRFQTQLPTFCADEFEVSVQEYQDCVDKNLCTVSKGENLTCNSIAKGRAEHPMNCITHKQATSVCAATGKRLPTEIEWEYLARGGKEMRPYPWGAKAPDDNTCWKHAGTCKRGSFQAGAFGLHDVVGNVWEWTDSWFGRYPWPEKSGRTKVIRGGSWSRRFDKWMRPTLRNRLDPEKSGSHLGVRCVLTLKDEICPYGNNEDDTCRAGVDKVQCLDNKTFNGARCVKKGDTERCRKGYKEEPGFGCVGAQSAGKLNSKLDLSGITRSRSPQFDSDCKTNTPARPQAYRFEGGGHLGRNIVGARHGCKNRDVGVGFNSACCP